MRLLAELLTVSDGFYTERAERSLQPPLQKCRKAAPPKKCREVSTTVVLNQGGFNEVVSRVPWTLDPSELKKKGQKVEGKCRRLKKKKKKKKRRSNGQRIRKCTTKADKD